MIKGIYKKGQIIQSINFINSSLRITEILLDASKKDPTNSKVQTMMGDMAEIITYVAYLERTLADSEIDNQVLLKKISNLQTENKELWKVKK